MVKKEKFKTNSLDTYNSNFKNQYREKNGQTDAAKKKKKKVP